MSIAGSDKVVNIKDLITTQELTHEMIKRMKANYGKDSKTRKTKHYMKLKIEALKKMWATFECNHQHIMQELASEERNLDYFKKNVYCEASDSFIEFLADMEQYQEDTFGQTTPTLPQTERKEEEAIMEPKLPAIHLPKFSGDYKAWTSFRDLFVTLIHDNKRIPDVQKLYHLKSNLTEEAEQLLRHVSVTDANYKTAWEILVQRYENKRVLVSAQIQRLFTQNNISIESSDSIKRLIDTTNESLMALENLGIDTAAWDPLIIYILTQKLPMETLQSWEHTISDQKELPTFDCLKQFLEARFRALEMIGSTKRFEKEQRHKLQPQAKPSKSFHTMSQNKCCVCGGNHNIRKCMRYARKDIAAKRDIAKDNDLCTNCLTKGHNVTRCYSSKNCEICGKRHHQLLHTNENNDTNVYKKRAVNYGKPTSSKDNTTASQEVTTTFHCNLSTNILLATALVRVSSSNGTHIMRALLDQGSQTSFITEAAVQSLRLPKQRVHAAVSGIGHQIKENCKSKVNLNIMSTNNDKSTSIEALVLKTITKLIPNTVIYDQHWPHLEGLTLADPNYLQPGKIDLLLGADAYADIILNGLKRGPINAPIAQNTIFGWIISGKAMNAKRLGERINVNNFHNRMELDYLLKSFWEVEELEKPKELTIEDKRCSEIFDKTHSRDSEGRYIVQLPFKEGTDKNSIGKSRHIALARFRQIERRLSMDPELNSEYTKCLTEYLDLNHMKPIPNEEKESYDIIKGTQPANSYYLPHHPVMKVDSSTTKLRIVFNASQKTDKGTSLNDLLLTGPVLQDDLRTIIMRWRRLKYVYSADVEKMYRQIKVQSQHQRFQRVLWRTQTKEPIREFCLTRVTFGFTSAAFLAVRAMRQLALDEGIKFPLAQHILLNDFYVDNVLSGADTLEEAIKQKDQLISLLQLGGFPLKKWSANNERIISDLPEEYQEKLLNKNLFLDDKVKTLGLLWNPSEDTFHYKLSLNPLDEHVTKRIVASVIAKIFDPIGWCAPVTIVGKIMLQDLWLIETDWDTELPTNIVQKFLKYHRSLADINQVKIPRWIGTATHSAFELHGFCDASNKAYAAVIYLRLLNKESSPNTFLLTASTKVAPIKTISIPRLELCGALLLAKILKRTINTLTTQPTSIYAWTDSSIVLAWLNGHPSKWKCFVANRVTEIKSLMTGATWRHISSEDNPADCASRGLTPEDLIKHKIWWTGPLWLQRKCNEWPNNLYTDTEEELRNTRCLISRINSLPEFLTKFSKLKTLIRVTAYMFRFINKCRKTAFANSVWLSPSELTTAFHFLVKENQYLEFSKEIRTLQEKKILHKTSRLIKLHPFLDKHGLIRVGGRIQQSNLSYEEKHPLILTDKTYFTELLIRHTHLEVLHGGPQLTLNTLRQKFWILNARNTVRQIINKCVICVRQKERTEQQLMGSLPIARVTQSRPFSHTGIDYCGPFNIRMSKGRGTKSQKCYVAIFICMSVKAVHIELVGDLTTQSFLAALKRFTARRGLPSDLYSDCGTNFIGATRVLDKDMQNILATTQNEVAEIIANDAITWHFNPPASPNFGGLWEAAVKSTKFHMKRLLKDRLLTYEEFNTVLVQIEGILNSRPISPVTNDLEDLTSLTPGHFLTGAPINSVPEPSLLNTNENYLTRWHLVQQLSQNFWKRWHQEYIHQLQQRKKWESPKTDIRVGDLVLIKEPNLHQNKWLLGRVNATYPGMDHLTRVVDITTINGELKRPITKICKLPIEQAQN